MAPLPRGPAEPCEFGDRAGAQHVDELIGEPTTSLGALRVVDRSEAVGVMNHLGPAADSTAGVYLEALWAGPSRSAATHAGVAGADNGLGSVSHLQLGED